MLLQEREDETESDSRVQRQVGPGPREEDAHSGTVPPQRAVQKRDMRAHDETSASQQTSQLVVNGSNGPIAAASHPGQIESPVPNGHSDPPLVSSLNPRKLPHSPSRSHVEPESDMQTLESRRQEVRWEIQQWNLDFRARHARDPTKAEKNEVKHLYSKYLLLSKEIKRRGESSTRRRPRTSDDSLPLWIRLKLDAISSKHKKQRPHRSRGSTMAAASAVAQTTTHHEALSLVENDALPEAAEAASIDDIFVSMVDGIGSKEQADTFMEVFDRSAKENQIEVMSVNRAELEERERRVRDERRAELQACADEFEKQTRDLAFREEGARQRVNEMASRMRREQKAKDALLELRDLSHRRNLRHQFEQTVTKIKAALSRRHAYLAEAISRWTIRERPRMDYFHPRFEAEPQAMAIRVEMLRALRDKVSPGKYSVSVAVVDRLGGHVLERLADKCPHPSVTAPVQHRGRHFDTELRLSKCVFSLCPSQREAGPSQIFLFQLIRLADDDDPLDTPVAWAAMPLLNSSLAMAQGSFRLPLLKGPYDLSVIRFSQIEERFSTDLSQWLCNMYIQIKQVPLGDFLRTGEFNAAPGEVHISVDHAMGQVGKAADRVPHRSGDENPPPSTFGEASAPKALEECIRWKRAKTEADLETFTPSMAPPMARRQKSTAAQIVASKLAFLHHELFSGYQNHGKQHAFQDLVVVLMAAWCRMYLHYFGQWLFLKANSVPLFGVKAGLFSVTIKYIATSVDAPLEIGVVGLGAFMPVICVYILSICCWTHIRGGGALPPWVSTFAAALAFSTVLDPLLIAAMDSMLGNYLCQKRGDCAEDYTADSCTCVEGDIFKLYYRLERDNSGAVLGLLITIIVYSSTTIVALGMLYMYLLHVHQNGRMLDTYSRLHKQREDIFVPHDLEISEAELRTVCIEAEDWAGPAGERRLVSVCDFDFVDPIIGNFEDPETTTHVAIYVTTLDGERTLWRQFLRTPDGAIIEVTGGLSEFFSADTKHLSTLSPTAASKSAGAGYFASI